MFKTYILALVSRGHWGLIRGHRGRHAMAFWDEEDDPFQFMGEFDNKGPPCFDEPPDEMCPSEGEDVAPAQAKPPPAGELAAPPQSDMKPLPAQELAAPELPIVSSPSSTHARDEHTMVPLDDLQTPLKRRRLHSKTKPGPEYSLQASSEEGACSPWQGLKHASREEYTKWYNKAKYNWLKAWVDGKPTGYWTKQAGWYQKLSCARAEFQKLTQAEKKDVVSDCIAEHEGSLQPLEEEKDYCDGYRVVCLTTEYSLPEDRFDNPDVKELGGKMAALPTDSVAYCELLERFKKLPSVAADWEAFVKFCESKAEPSSATELSMSMELSTHSDIPGRYHFHAVWSCLRGKPAADERAARMNFGKMSAWRFQGRSPHVVVNSKQGGRNHQKLVNRGHGYLQIRKTGKLYDCTNWPKNHAWVCDSSWVLQWWQLQKLSTAQAEEEVLENKHRVESALKQLWFYNEHVKEAANRKEQAALKVMLSKSLKAYKQFPTVNKWKAQYMPAQYGKRLRYKFLVLVGASCLGKTQYAMHLYGAGSTFYSNCQNIPEPNLGGFERGVHLAIVLDEVEPEMVIKNKALFQCNAEGVNLQESRCQQNAVWRFLYSVPLVVCTNSWELGRLPSVDSDWLRTNTEVLHLQERTWLD